MSKNGRTYISISNREIIVLINNNAVRFSKVPSWLISQSLGLSIIIFIASIFVHELFIFGVMIALFSALLFVLFLGLIILQDKITKMYRESKRDLKK